MTRSPSHAWSTADAKARLSELIARARSSPQVIQSRGVDVAVVVSIEEMGRLRDRAAAPLPTPMERFLAAAEELRSEGALELKIPPRRSTSGRRLRPLGP